MCSKVSLHCRCPSAREVKIICGITLHRRIAVEFDFSCLCGQARDARFLHDRARFSRGIDSRCLLETNQLRVRPSNDAGCLLMTDATGRTGGRRGRRRGRRRLIADYRGARSRHPAAHRLIGRRCAEITKSRAYRNSISGLPGNGRWIPRVLEDVSKFVRKQSLPLPTLRVVWLPEHNVVTHRERLGVDGLRRSRLVRSLVDADMLEVRAKSGLHVCPHGRLKRSAGGPDRGLHDRGNGTLTAEVYLLPVPGRRAHHLVSDTVSFAFGRIVRMAQPDAFLITSLRGAIAAVGPAAKQRGRSWGQDPLESAGASLCRNLARPQLAGPPGTGCPS